MLANEHIEDILPIAQNVRALIDEIMLRMSYLPEEDKSSESPHLLALFDLLASVIDEEIVVQAAVFADKGAVVLHTSIAPTFQSASKQAKVAGSVEELDDIANEQDAPEFNCHAEEKPLPVRAIKTPQLLNHESIDIFDDIEQDDIFNPALFDQTTCGASQVSSCTRVSHISFQEGQVANFSLNVTTLNPDEQSESSECTEAELPPQKIEKGLRFYEVICNNSDQSIYLFPRVNYCTCDFYRKNVIEERKDFTCCHVLATWLSEALGTTRIVHSRPDTLKHMADFFVERTDEFH